MKTILLPAHWLADDYHPWRPTLEEVARAYKPAPPPLTETARAVMVAAASADEMALWWLVASAPLWAVSCVATADWLRESGLQPEDARQNLLTLGALWGCGDELQGLAWRALRIGLSEQVVTQGRRRAHEVLGAYLSGCSWLWDPQLAEVRS